MDNNIDNIESLDVPTNVSLGTPIMPGTSTLNSSVESLEGPSNITLNNLTPSPDLIKPAPIEEAPKKRKKSGKFILILLLVLIIVIGGFISYELLLIKPIKYYHEFNNKVFDIFASYIPENKNEINDTLIITSSENTYNISFTYKNFEESDVSNIILSDNNATLLNMNLYNIDNSLYLKANNNIYLIGNYLKLSEIDLTSVLNLLNNIINSNISSDDLKRTISFDNKTIEYKNSLSLNSTEVQSYLNNLVTNIKNNEELLKLVTNDIDSMKKDLDNLSFNPKDLNIIIYTSFIKNEINQIDLTYKSYNLVIKNNNFNLKYDNKEILNGIVDNNKIKVNNIIIDSNNYTLSSEVNNTNDLTKETVETKDYIKINKDNIKLLFKLNKTRKNNNVSDLTKIATSLVESAQKAYDEVKNTISFKSGNLKNICFDAAYLKNKGYFTNDNVNASVLIKESGDKLYWIADNNSYYELVNINTTNAELKTGTIPNTISTCGNSLSVKATCFNDTCNAK